MTAEIFPINIKYGLTIVQNCQIDKLQLRSSIEKLESACSFLLWMFCADDL